MPDGKGDFLPVLLLAEVGEVVVAEQAVGNAALPHPLLAEHHKPEICRDWREIVQNLFL